MALQGKLPKLSQFASKALAEMGFKAITGRPYEFIGIVKNQQDDYGMAALLTVMPLKLQKHTYVVSLDMNGESMVSTRIAGIDDIANLVGYAGVIKEIIDTVNQKENDDDSTNRGSQPSNNSRAPQGDYGQKPH